MRCVDPFHVKPPARGLRYYRVHGIGGYRRRYTDEQLYQLSRHPANEAVSCFLFNSVTVSRDAARFRKLLK